MELGIGQSVGVWNMWCGCLEYVVWVSGICGVGVCRGGD